MKKHCQSISALSMKRTEYPWYLKRWSASSAGAELDLVKRSCSVPCNRWKSENLHFWDWLTAQPAPHPISNSASTSCRQGKDGSSSSTPLPAFHLFHLDFWAGWGVAVSNSPQWRWLWWVWFVHSAGRVSEYPSRAQLRGDRAFPPDSWFWASSRIKLWNSVQ